jgi:uncharacterized membrane protein YcjF (UPF0283 family)
LNDSSPTQSSTPIGFSLPHIGSLIRRAWVWTRRIVVAVLIATLTLFVLEAIHLHRLLASIHPVLAWSVTGAILAALLGFGGWAAWRWVSVPRAVAPPDLPSDASTWTRDHLRSYLRFAERFGRRQELNDELPEASRARLQALFELVRAADATEPPADVVARIEREIDQILEPLDRKARNEVWRSATQIAVLTAVNPSALLDVLITLMRSVEMMARLAQMYYGRPGVLGTFRVVSDVLAVAATAGVVERIADSAGEVASELVGSWTSRLAGPVGQGITNGLLAVRLGDAAVERCRSLRSRRVGIKPWDRTMWREMASRLAAAAGRTVGSDLGRGFSRAAARASRAGEDVSTRAARLIHTIFVRRTLEERGPDDASAPDGF